MSHVGANAQGHNQALAAELEAAKTRCDTMEETLKAKIEVLKDEVTALTGQNAATEIKLAELKGTSGSELAAVKRALEDKDAAAQAATTAKEAAEQQAKELKDNNTQLAKDLAAAQDEAKAHAERLQEEANAKDDMAAKLADASRKAEASEACAQVRL